jgi:hypothetical protein
MKPFLFNTAANARLAARYPYASEVAYAYKALAKDGREGILRSLLTEGIPYAFQNLPVLYEIVRDFISKRLGVEPRQVTLIGSARVGYSLAPPPEYGRPFGDESDLDLTIFSETLFTGLVFDFTSWQQDLESGRVTRTGLPFEKYWDENLRVVPLNIRRGFVDPHKVPLDYFWSGKVSETMWRLHKKLRTTPGPPTLRHVGVRVYTDWQAFVKQQSLNLAHCFRDLPA